MTTSRRERGSGSIWIREDAQGRQKWYGKVWVNGRQVKRVLGPVRQRGSADGLTRGQALKALQKLATETGAPIPRDQRMSVRDAGDIYLKHLETVKGRKPTTLTDYRGILTNHLGPFTQGRTLDAVDRALLDQYVSAKLADGLSHKTVRNHLTFLGGLYRFASKRGWVTNNPVAEVDMPEAGQTHGEIRFLTPEELAALYRAAPPPLTPPRTTLSGWTPSSGRPTASCS